MLLSNSDSNSDGKDKLIRFTEEFLLWPGFEWLIHVYRIKFSLGFYLLA
jgi:hypothetical protein